jgi:GDP-L-fucose synthase
MNVLITGGRGSLGQAVVREIKSMFHQAKVFEPRREDLDLLDAVATANYIEEIQPTHVIHLAAKVYGIQGHSKFPLDSLLSNTRIDLNLFSALAANPPKWVFYASTVAAYGYPFRNLPLTEVDLFSTVPHKSEYGYAQSKRFALNYLELLNEHSGTNFVYGLLTNLFGTEDRHLQGNGHVLISIAEKAKRAREIDGILEIWGDGTASRDFLSTSSAAKIICGLLDQHTGPINIGSGIEIHISELAQLAVEIFDVKKGYIFTGENQGITRRFSSIEKLIQFSPNAQHLDVLSEIENFMKELK